MKNKLKKTLALTSAAALAACQWVSTGVFAADEQANATQFPFTIEGEDMTDATLWTSIYENEAPGYSGEGFVYITGNPVSFKLTVPEDGMYKVNVRGIQILDQGGRLETIAINGVEYSKTVPYCREWTDIDFGVVRLKAGENEISFLNKYGYLAIDTVTVSMAEFPDVTTASGVPCDPKATNEAKALMKYLHSVYGKHILSGQQEIYGNGHEVQTSIRYDAEKDICVDEKGVEYTIDRESSDTDDAGNKFYWHCSGADGKTYTYNTQNRIYVYQNYEQEFDYIYDLTGAYPAVRGFDFMNYNPLYGWDDGTTQRVIEWVNERGGIATACWHINIPTDFDTYTPGEAVDWSKATYKVNHQFKIANAVKEGTKENEYLDLAIEDLAEQFIILQDNNVPILFRPFHEAEGNPSNTSDPIDGSGAWFWWSQDGAEDYKELWKYLYTQLTEKYGLHNIIWEQNLYAWSDASAEWYSGDDYVDIVGWDKYDTQYNRHDGLTSGPNEDCNSNVYWSLYDYVKGNKMAAIMENSTIPSLGNMTVEQTAWLYFCTWYDNGQDNFMSSDDYNNPDTVKELYQSDFCINLDDLPEDLYVYSGQSDIMYGDTNEDGEVNLADAVLIMQNIANPSKYKISEQGKLNGDVDENGDGITSNDAFKIQQFVLGIISSLKPNA